jgi:hypothetical protein
MDVYMDLPQRRFASPSPPPPRLATPKGCRFTTNIMSTYIAALGLALAATFSCFARSMSDLHILSTSPLHLVNGLQAYMSPGTPETRFPSENCAFQSILHCRRPYLKRAYTVANTKELSPTQFRHDRYPNQVLADDNCTKYEQPGHGSGSSTTSRRSVHRRSAEIQKPTNHC